MQSDPPIKYTITQGLVWDHPVKRSTRFYMDLGRTVTDLTIVGVAEEDLRGLIHHFKNLRRLCFKVVNLLQRSAFGFPKHLEHLCLVDCRIVVPLVQTWFGILSEAVTSVDITRSFFCGNSNRDDYTVHRAIKLLKNLRHMRQEHDIELHQYSLEGEMEELLSVEFKARTCDSLYGYPDAPIFVFDAIGDVTKLMKYKDITNDVIQVMTVRQLPATISKLRNFVELRHLTVLDSIDVLQREELEKLTHITTKVYHCREPPKTEDAMLMLDDDSLSHVFSFVKPEDLISLLSVHSRTRDVVCKLILPHTKMVVGEDLVMKYPIKQNEELYKTIGRHFRRANLTNYHLMKLVSFFPNLKEIYLPLQSDCDVSAIPPGIETLSLYLCDSWDLTYLLQMQAASLKHLTLEGPFEPKELLVLNGIRSLSCGGYTSSNIDLTEFLEKNKDTLEVLEVTFYEPDDEDDISEGIDPNHNFTITTPLPKLKTLRLDRIPLMIHLSPRHMPSLENVVLNVNYPDHVTQVEGLSDMLAGFRNLRKLECLGTLYDYTHLFELEKLETLVFHDREVQEFIIMDCIRELPKLKKMGTHNAEYSLELEMDLQKVLLEENRSFTLFNTFNDNDSMHFERVVDHGVEFVKRSYSTPYRSRYS